MIEATGGVVWRPSPKGPEVLLVHRPRYDDWSLPKGKLDPGESARQAAIREVEEETGLVCDVGKKLDEVRYRDRKGRAKRVRYWAMQPVGGDFMPNDEVDEVRWVDIHEVDDLLSYAHDVVVVAASVDQIAARYGPEPRTPSAPSAAWRRGAPHMPCTPAPGGVAAEHRYTPGMPVRVGVGGQPGAEHQLPGAVGAGGDVAAHVVGVVLPRTRPGSGTCVATIRSRRPGANRSSWSRIASVASPV